jgi:very-short-patch-repair endonuclease
LEIDGRTHDDCGVIAKDRRKDEFLIKNGWKWINDKKHYDRLEIFLKLYNIYGPVV